MAVYLFIVVVDGTAGQPAALTPLNAGTLTAALQSLSMMQASMLPEVYVLLLASKERRLANLSPLKKKRR